MEYSYLSRPARAIVAKAIAVAKERYHVTGASTAEITITPTDLLDSFLLTNSEPQVHVLAASVRPSPAIQHLVFERSFYNPTTWTMSQAAEVATKDIKVVWLPTTKAIVEDSYCVWQDANNPAKLATSNTLAHAILRATLGLMATEDHKYLTLMHPETHFSLDPAVVQVILPHANSYLKLSHFHFRTKLNFPTEITRQVCIRYFGLNGTFYDIRDICKELDLGRETVETIISDKSPKMAIKLAEAFNALLSKVEPTAPSELLS